MPHGDANAWRVERGSKAVQSTIRRSEMKRAARKIAPTWQLLPVRGKFLGGSMFAAGDRFLASSARRLTRSPCTELCVHGSQTGFRQVAGVVRSRSGQVWLPRRGLARGLGGLIREERLQEADSAPFAVVRATFPSPCATANPVRYWQVRGGGLCWLPSDHRRSHALAHAERGHTAFRHRFGEPCRDPPRSPESCRF